MRLLKAARTILSQHRTVNAFAAERTLIVRGDSLHGVAVTEVAGGKREARHPWITFLRIPKPALVGDRNSDLLGEVTEGTQLKIGLHSECEVLGARASCPHLLPLPLEEG
jgi:hypothetical protein